MDESYGSSPQREMFFPFLVGPIPPAPFPTRKGGAHGFLKVCIPSCSDGFERIDHALETQTPRTTSRHSPFLTGTGVAYNEA